MAKADRAFIRRAVECSDLAALRIAIYQASGDEEIARLGPVATLDTDQRMQLIDRCVELLVTELPTWKLRIPGDDELRQMIDMVVGEPCGDGDFELRKGVLSFDEFPFFAQWPTGSDGLPEDFRVAIIGGGFNGVATAVQLEQLGIPYTLYERRHELGGTWSINRYPDIRVDTLSAAYEYSFEKNFQWSEYFARGPEVKGYLHHIVDKYGVAPHVRVDHDLVEARFDESTGRWHLTFDGPDGATVTSVANAVVSASGLFANPNLPDFPGVEGFKGQIVHPTQWPEDLDLSGKRVAVIGNGSTGVQLLGRIAETAAHVDVFQRTPQWISPRAKYGDPIEPESRWLTSEMPGYWNWGHLTSVMHLFNFHRDYLIRDPEFEAAGGQISATSDRVRSTLVEYIHRETGGRQDLIEQLIPDYAPMVRRPIVDNGWYRALTRDNVELVTDDIQSFTETGIRTVDGTDHDVDVVVSATGFDIVKYMWPAEYFGRGGVNLHDRWDEESPMAYVGMMVPDFPNLFILYGPNSQPVSGGIALPTWFQMWAGFVARSLISMIDQRKTTVEVTREAFVDYNERLHEESQNLIMVTEEASARRNYYVNHLGRMQVNAPWETSDYFKLTTDPDHVPSAIRYA